MFKIGEFSKITQISIRMLRYYDEQKLLEPCIVDKATGYRLYSANQIDQLNKIIFLRNMGFSVQEMKTMLHTDNLDSVKQYLLGQMKKTEENITAEEMRLKQIKGFLYDLENAGSNLDIDINLKQLPMQQVVSMRKILPDYYAESQLWKEFGQKFRKTKDIQKLQSFSIYHDLDYREKDVDIEICIVTDDMDICSNKNDVIFRQIEQVDLAACFMIYGPYTNIGKAYKEFAYWLEQHQEYRMQGENRQVCHISQCQTDNPNEYVTEMQIPLIQN